MINKENYTILQNCIEAKTKNISTQPNDYQYFIKDTTPTDIKDTLRDIITHNLYNSLSDMDINYEMLNQAIMFYYDIDYDNLSDYDQICDLANQQVYASIWNSTRLSYITNSNEDEVYDILKEYDTKSINEAAAIWYDQQVLLLIEAIYNQLINTNN